MKKVFYIMILLAMVFTACAPKPAAPTEAAPVETAAPAEPAATAAPVEPLNPRSKNSQSCGLNGILRTIFRKWAISMKKRLASRSMSFRNHGVVFMI